MRLELRGHHVDVTPVLRKSVESKVGKLERYLSARAVSTQIVLTREKHRHRVDITLHARGDKFLHGVADTSDWESAVAEAVEKIVQQAQKIKGKWQARKRQSAKGAPAAAAGNGAVQAASAAPSKRLRARKATTLKASRQAIKPMSVADAAREAEEGEGCVVFRDLETQAINVVYRRQDGQLALVETEV
jgi:putative sigma-54 modulation protein